MTKCNFCQDLLAEGGDPACVDACPMRALEFGDVEELRAKYGTVDAIEPLPSGDHTHPSFVVTPHKSAEAVGAGTGHILNLPEEI
jgi:anaerobic dimethyl sulfoxide reductase subunit B (iron-sulfur subunit)